MVEILKQGQYVPLTVEMQIVHILAGDEGVRDDIDVDKVGVLRRPSHFFETSHFEAEPRRASSRASPRSATSRPSRRTI